MPETGQENAGPLANIQRVITLSALALATGWAVWTFTTDRPFLGIAGLAVVFTAHAAVLALEFILMARVNTNAGQPTIPFHQVLVAWLGEALYAPKVFCWRQPFQSRVQADHLPPPSSRSKRGVLLIHGFFCNRGLWIDWIAKLKERDHACVALNLAPVFGGIDEYIPLVEAAVQKLERATGLPPVIVAHSMGGLAARRWWAQDSHSHRVHRLITLGTPHHGTWLAKFALSPNARQMRLESPWLRSLQRIEPSGHVRRMTCFYSHCDNIVYPAPTATIPGADNRPLSTVSHVHMVERPEPFEELLRHVA